MQIKLRFYNLLRSKKMDKSKEQLDELIVGIQQKLDDAKRKRDKLNVTYSIGDRFVRGNTKWIIVVQTKGTSVTMANLNNGALASGSASVGSHHHITPAELEKFSAGHVTRYWDARKKERC